MNESNNTKVYLSTIINGNVNLKCYNSNDIVPYSLRKIAHNDLISLTYLHAPTE